MSIDIEAMASQHYGAPLRLEYGGELVVDRTRDGRLSPVYSGYTYGWHTVEILYQSKTTNSIGGQQVSAKERQERRLTAPDGKVLLVDGARVYEYSTGNYPCGDYCYLYE